MPRIQTKARISSYGWTSDQGVTVDVRVEQGAAPLVGRSFRAPVTPEQATGLLRYAALFNAPSVEPDYGGGTPVGSIGWRAYQLAFDEVFTTLVAEAIKEARKAGATAASDAVDAYHRRLTEDGWLREHQATKGQHFGLNGPTSSAAANCPLCA